MGLDPSGQVLARCLHSKVKLLEITPTMAPCRIGMRVCGGVHHPGRQLLAQGQHDRLIPPRNDKAFVKHDKTPRTPRPVCAQR